MEARRLFCWQNGGSQAFQNPELSPSLVFRGWAHLCGTSIYLFLFCRINTFCKVKDLECVKSYVDLKWETILDSLLVFEQFDFFLELIKRCKIPKEKYLSHKGEMFFLNTLLNL